MRYLVLEGSAVAASCALLENQKVLGEFFVNIPQTHSQTLLPMVQAVFRIRSADPVIKAQPFFFVCFSYSSLSNTSGK